MTPAAMMSPQSTTAMWKKWLMPASGQLTPEPPGADAHEQARQGDERDQIRIDDVEPGALDEHAARDRGEVGDRVEKRERLHPLRHRLDRREPARQHRERRIDEEADQLGLAGRARERRDEGAEADAGQHAARAGGEQE